MLRRNFPLHADRKLFKYQTQLTALREAYKLDEDKEGRDRLQKEAKELKTLIGYLT